MPPASAYASRKTTLIFGTVVVAVVGVAVAAGIYAASRRRPITADNVNEVPTPVAAEPVAAGR